MEVDPKEGVQMRIALVSPPWLPVPPPAYGGTEAVIDRLARGFAAAGHEVVLFATGDSTCPVPTRWILAEAATGRMGNAVTEIHHVAHAYDVVRSFDIIHDHTLIGPLFAAQLGDLPVVTTNHGPFTQELQSLYRSISPRVPIIAISPDQARSAGPVPVAAVIHHGIDPAAFPVGAGDGDYFLYLGRMAATKGVRTAAAVARRAGVRLMIAAKNREPAEHEYFEREVLPLLGDGVVYLGEVGEREKLELLGRARALLNPIAWPEPFGLAMVEALACGTPVLAFANGSAPEIVQHGVTGFLCRDDAEMEAALSRVDELDRRACRQSVEQSFSAERMVREHLNLFTRLVSGRSERRPRVTNQIRSGRPDRSSPVLGVDDVPA
ncbi:MAG: glycosyltransferase family 4 protein [Acidimicrobiales bacterium]